MPAASAIPVPSANGHEQTDLATVATDENLPIASEYGPDEVDTAAIDAIEAELTGKTAPKPAAKPKSPVVAPGPEVQTAEQKHPDWMVEQARDLGIEDDVIGSVPTAALAKLVTRELRRERAEAKRDRQAETVTPAVPSDPVAAFWAEQGEVDDGGKQVKVADVEFHPALKKVIETLARDLHGLKAAKAQTETVQQTAAEAAMQAEFDAAFSKLKTLFADGDAAAVKKSNAKAFAKRSTVYAEVMRRKWPRGTTVESAVATVTEELFDVTPESPLTTESPGARPKVSPYTDATVARPTTRTAAKPKGRAKAESAVEEWLERNAGAEDDGVDANPDAEY